MSFTPINPNDSNNLKKVVEDNCDRLIQKKNVVGVAVGNKWTNGQDTGVEAILVFVEQKEDLKNIPTLDRIEETVDGVQTDVVGRSGTFAKQANTAKFRPILGGISCGHLYVTAGTIGGIFEDKDGDVVLLSNNHVLANEAPFYRARLYNPVSGRGHITIQPGAYDKGGFRSRIGQLKKYMPLKRIGNYEDSAIAVFQPENWGSTHGWYGGTASYEPRIKDLGEIKGWNDAPSINLDVQKSGRTTGYTTGKVIGLHATVSVSYDHGTLQFKDCIVTSNMSEGGDSGSLLLDMSNNVVGLLFAGSSEMTLHNPIKYPRETYGLEIINTTLIEESSAINIVTVDGATEIPFSIETLQTVIDDAKKSAKDGGNITIEVLYNVKPQL